MRGHIDRRDLGRKDFERTLKLLYVDQPQFEQGPAIFLAGPTPRSHSVKSWRPNAVEILERLGYDGTVLIPEGSQPDNTWPVGFMTQVEWEHAGLENCTVVCFWIPRDMMTLPGLTTNVEFGRYVGRRPMVYGRPDGAPHTGYLDWLFKKIAGGTACSTMEDTLRAAMAVRPKIQRAYNTANAQEHEFDEDRQVCIRCGLLMGDILDEKGDARFRCSRVA